MHQEIENRAVTILKPGKEVLSMVGMMTLGA